MHIIGTAVELEQAKARLPDEIYAETLRIVTMLDDQFGSERDVENDDGGYVAIVETLDDLNDFSKQCVELDSPALEYVEPVGVDYISAFYLYNEYAFGITLLMPITIAPATLIRELDNSQPSVFPNI